METVVIEAGAEIAKGATGELSSTAWGAIVVLFFVMLAACGIFIGYCILRGGGWTANFLNDAKERHFAYVGDLNNSVRTLTENQVKHTEISRQTVETMEDMRRECVEGHKATQALFKECRREKG